MGSAICSMLSHLHSKIALDMELFLQVRIILKWEFM